MESALDLAKASDDALIRRLEELVSQSRRVEADLVAHIGEVEARRLYAREASPSMFAYCTDRLHLSEGEAYARIRVARAARRYPVLLAMLRDGRLHLSGLVRLVPHLTPENCDRLLARAVHKSKRQVEELVAELFPQPDAPTVVRTLHGGGSESAAPRSHGELAATGSGPAVPQLCPGTVGERPVVQPLAPARYKVQFTASAELREKLGRLQALMRSEVPDGDLATVIERAVSEKLERLEARRFATTTAPRKGLAESRTSPASRHVPAAVRRAVVQRDGRRCGYVDDRGRRCTETHRLEFHHRFPFGMGGDHSPGNVGLRCRAHNLLDAEADYGQTAIRKRLRAKVTSPEAPTLHG